MLTDKTHTNTHSLSLSLCLALKNTHAATRINTYAKGERERLREREWERERERNREPMRLKAEMYEYACIKRVNNMHVCVIGEQRNLWERSCAFKCCVFEYNCRAAEYIVCWCFLFRGLHIHVIAFPHRSFLSHSNSMSVCCFVIICVCMCARVRVCKRICVRVCVRVHVCSSTCHVGRKGISKAHLYFHIFLCYTQTHTCMSFKCLMHVSSYVPMCMHQHILFVSLSLSPSLSISSSLLCKRER